MLGQLPPAAEIFGEFRIMLGRRHEIARLQSDFYRYQFRRLLRWLLAACGVILLLILVIIYFILFQKPQKYYANTTEGKILEMVSYETGVR